LKNSELMINTLKSFSKINDLKNFIVKTYIKLYLHFLSLEEVFLETIKVSNFLLGKFQKVSYDYLIKFLIEKKTIVFDMMRL